MARSIWVVVAGLTGMALAGLMVQTSAAPHGAQAPPGTTIKEVPCVAIASVDGKENYDAYCATCHGTDGKGNGPAAPALKGPVPDLTAIASRSGKFDRLAVEASISGRDRRPPAHGTVSMPIWGPVFKGTTPDTHVTTLRIQNLVKYLESIQQR